MENKIVASFIIEIMGRPKEYVEDNLKKLIEKLGEEKGVNVTDYKTHEPRKLEITKTKEDAEKLKKLKEDRDLAGDAASILRKRLDSVQKPNTRK